MQYAVIVHHDEDGGYWSEVPSLPGCVSQGETLDETIANTREAIGQWMDYLKEKGELPPTVNDIVLAVDVAA